MMIASTIYPVAILAGGLATRLRPITEKIPKALLPINGESFIFHQLRLLQRQNIKRVVLCIGYLGEMIESVVGTGKQFDLQVEYSFDGAKLLGTGGALKQALPLLGERFFVLYGDSYLPCDFYAVQQHYYLSQKPALMTVYHNKGLWDSSNIEFSDNKIIAYDKKNRTPKMQYIDYGLGILNGEIFANFADNESFDLATVYQKLLHQQQLAAYEIQQRFYEVGSVSGIEEFSNYLLEEIR